MGGENQDVQLTWGKVQKTWRMNVDPLHTDEAQESRPQIGWKWKVEVTSQP